VREGQEELMSTLPLFAIIGKGVNLDEARLKILQFRVLLGRPLPPSLMLRLIALDEAAKAR
jgi:hypothetical protein